MNNNHPDFLIESVGDGHELLLIAGIAVGKKKAVDFINFGLYNHWWQAEREARKMQKWRNAELWY